MSEQQESRRFSFARVAGRGFCFLACASKVRDGVCPANLEWTRLAGLNCKPSSAPRGSHHELPDGWLCWLCMISFFIPVINDASRRSRSAMAPRHHKITRNESLERPSLQTTEGMNHHAQHCMHAHMGISLVLFVVYIIYNIDH